MSNHISPRWRYQNGQIVERNGKTHDIEARHERVIQTKTGLFIPKVDIYGLGEN